MFKRMIKRILFRDAAGRALRRRMQDPSRQPKEPRRRVKSFCNEMDEVLEWTRRRQGA